MQAYGSSKTKQIYGNIGLWLKKMNWRSKDREEEDQYTHRQRIRENTERGEQRNRDYWNNKKGLY